MENEKIKKQIEKNVIKKKLLVMRLIGTIYMLALLVFYITTEDKIVFLLGVVGFIIFFFLILLPTYKKSKK
jgi:hypothetical protein